MGGKQAIQQRFEGLSYWLCENRNAPIELYNLSEDIAEANNMAGRFPDITEEIDSNFRTSHVLSQRFLSFLRLNKLLKIAKQLVRYPDHYEVIIRVWLKN